MITTANLKPEQDGALKIEDLDQPYCCVIQLRTQPQGVIHQVILRPGKVKDGLIRIGDSQGDEASGWQHPSNIIVLSILGTAKEEEILNQDDESLIPKKFHWVITPLETEDAVHSITK